MKAAWWICCPSWIIRRDRDSIKIWIFTGAFSQTEGRGLSGKEFEELVQREMQKKTVTFPQLRKLAEIAAKHGISVASHDDDTIEKLDMNRELGVSISEFPITLEVAETAVKQGLQTVLGAPNILLGDPTPEICPHWRQFGQAPPIFLYLTITLRPCCRQYSV